MKFFALFRKVAALRFYAALILVGLLFVVFGGIGLFLPKGETVETEATITYISERYYDPASESEYAKVYVTYEANGVVYPDVLYPGYDSFMKPGDKLTILYDPADPTVIQSPGGEIAVLIVVIVGVIAVVAGTVMLVRTIRRSADDFNEYNRVDLSAVPQAQIDAIRNDETPKNRYYFHYDHYGAKAGHVMEDGAHHVVYEATMTKLTLFRPYEFLFTNHITHTSETLLIGHTVTTSLGTDNGAFSYQVPISSSFKINGQKNWDYLAERGYGFTWRFENLIRPVFDVTRYGVPVAYIETSGTNVFGEEGKSRLADIPANGYFRVDCREKDLDDIFLICMSITRAICYND